MASNIPSEINCIELHMMILLIMLILIVRQVLGEYSDSSPKQPQQLKDLRISNSSMKIPILRHIEI